MEARLTRSERGRLAVLSLGAAAAAGLALLLRDQEARANLAWTLASWKRPAGADAHWQQRAGRRIDPLGRLKRGI
ncbi:MAG: hypothetical protein ACR2PL_14300 [Dehalococcoidia bacterium]